MALTNFSVLRGDTFKKSVTYKDPENVAINLTGAVVSGAVGNKQITDVPFTVVVASPATLGKFTFELSAAQTAALEPGSYRYFVSIAYSNGVVQTLLNGSFVVAETGV
jgi:hypothetical protein